jgi:hypothetical protein
MVRNDDECARAARQAGTLLQEIQGHLGNRNIAEAKVRFPRGFIRTAGYFQKTLLFISNDTLRCNLSYLWLETEVYRWILVRTDLYGPAREMLIKRLIAEWYAALRAAGIRRLGLCTRQLAQVWRRSCQRKIRDAGALPMPHTRPWC